MSGDESATARRSIFPMNEPTEPDVATPIDDPSLRLPGPAVRGLVGAGVTSLGAAWAASDEEMLACHGVGPKAVRMIRELQARSSG
jgi:hypothetical protein